METEKCFEQYQEEIDKNYELWMTDDEWSDRLNTKHGKKIAMFLENQRLWHETERGKNYNFVEKVYKIYQHFIGFDLVSVRPTLGPAGVIYFKTNNKLESFEAYAKSRMLKKTDPECIAEEMNREIIFNIRNNVGTITTKSWNNKETIINAISETFDELSGVGKKWIVTSPDVAEILIGERVEHLIKSFEMLNPEWYVVVDPLYPLNEILIGYQDDFLDGYFYNPYVTLTDCEDRYITRHAKKLISNKMYGRIIFRN